MTALREEYPHASVELLCSLFGKRRQWYYKKSKVVVSESQRTKLLTSLIDYYRGLCPRIGGVKLYVLLSDDLGKEITRGRDSFLKFYASQNYRLPRNKPIHTTNSNHLYRKYPNLVKGLAAMCMFLPAYVLKSIVLCVAVVNEFASSSNIVVKSMPFSETATP